MLCKDGSNEHAVYKDTVNWPVSIYRKSKKEKQDSGARTFTSIGAFSIDTVCALLKNSDMIVTGFIDRNPEKGSQKKKCIRIRYRRTSMNFWTTTAKYLSRICFLFCNWKDLAEQGSKSSSAFHSAGTVYLELELRPLLQNQRRMKNLIRIIQLIIQMVMPMTSSMRRLIQKQQKSSAKLLNRGENRVTIKLILMLSGPSSSTMTLIMEVIILLGCLQGTN